MLGRHQLPAAVGTQRDKGMRDTLYFALEAQSLRGLDGGKDAPPEPSGAPVAFTQPNTPGGSTTRPIIQHRQTLLLLHMSGSPGSTKARHPSGIPKDTTSYPPQSSCPP
ncbi:hypothetical protein ATANTOWER_020393 [Ataeniobius toweri]|uniref:Uncharacterized protein n=1 Tax=Ataeniobius toweri TaxID=208326 RepID=A0ABU7C9F8_9TELE|nr:hypothetical protein [Ataeniobius toweri]